MKNLIIIIAVLFSTGLYAQKDNITSTKTNLELVKRDSINKANKPLSIAIQFAMEDTLNKKSYTFVLAQMKTTEWIFQYSSDWGITNKEVNSKIGAYKPLIISHDLLSSGNWKFVTSEGLFEPDVIFGDMVIAIMYPYLEKMKDALNRK